MNQIKKRSKISSGVTTLQFVDNGKQQQARHLRTHATPAEAMLWEKLRNRKADGFKFRRQQVIEGFIADFYCEEVKLVIEVDGSVHENPEQRELDKYRERVFNARGIHTMRIANDAIEGSLSESVDQIVKTARLRLRD